MLKNNNPVLIILAVTALAYWQTLAGAQPAPPPSRCPQVNYSAPPADLKSYRLSRVEGQAVYAPPAQKWESGPGGGLCLTLFNKKSGGRLANVTTDNNGQFAFANSVPGEYVLVAFAGDLQKIIVPLRLAPSGQVVKSRRLLLHLREKEDRRQARVTLITNAALRAELLRMVEEDQLIRKEMIERGAERPSQEIQSRMKMIDARNTARVNKIIAAHGWPGHKLVGWDGSEAAFLLVQHADHSSQKRLLPLVRKQYEAGTLAGSNYALLLDRVLVGDKRPQMYGTQAKPFAQWESGEPVLYPIADEAGVDRRRVAIGLSPLAEYRESLKQMYHPRNE